MKKFCTPFLLVFVFVAASSFKPEGYRDLFKSEGNISCTVNGQAFQLREKDYYRAMLVTKTNPFSLDVHERTRTATSLIFYGNDTLDVDSNTFSENITIEYTFSSAAVGEEAGQVGFEMSYNFGNYYMMDEKNFFKVTKLEWASDKTYFILNGNFNCMMHRRGYSDTQEPALRVKGDVTDIKVTVPPWIAAKINKETSQAEGQ